jgi:hypothetical protein
LILGPPRSAARLDRPAFYLIIELIKRAEPVFFSMVNDVATLVDMGLGI